MLKLFQYFDFTKDRGGDAPVAGMMESYFFQGDNFSPGGVGEGPVETLSAVDLSVGSLADLF